jgi:LysM repeat protein
MTNKWFRFITAIAVIAFSLSLVVLPASAQTTYITYTVQKGDTLGKIASQYCTTWKAIYDINRDTIGTNPSLIIPGMVLTVPANCNADSGSTTTPPSGEVYDRGPMTHATGVYYAPYYTVAWGDTLFSIGMRFGVPWQDIATANGIQGSTIYAGQALLIPDGNTSTPPPTQGPAERVYFQSGAISASRSGVIYEGVPKSYILWASAGQSLTVNTVSHGEPLVISIGNTKGDLLPLSGVNSQINNNVTAKLPESGDYIVTIRPVTTPENPQMAFDITFIIP